MPASELQNKSLYWNPQWQMALAEARASFSGNKADKPDLELLISRLIRHFLYTTQDSLAEDMQRAAAELGQKFKSPALFMLISRHGSNNDLLKVAVDIGGRSRAIKKLDYLCQQFDQLRQFTTVAEICHDNFRDYPGTENLLQQLDCDDCLLLPLTEGNTTAGLLFLISDNTSIKPETYELRLLNAFLELCYVVSERVLNYSELQQREELLARTEALAGIGSWDEDYSCNRITFTREAACIFELPAEITELTREQYIDYIHPDDREPAALRLLNSNQPSRFDGRYRIITAAGNIRHIRALSETIADDNDKLIGRRGLVQDITLQVQKEEHLKLAARVYDSIIEGVVISDAKGLIKRVNPAFQKITGYKESEVIDRPVAILDSRKPDKKLYRSIVRICLRHGFWQGEIWNRRKNGEIFPQHTTVTCLRDDQKKIRYFISVFEDISRIRRSEQQVDFLAHNDSLTGLPNRISLLHKIDDLLKVAAQKNSRVALLHIDLDHFKHINDSLGHPAGDRLLQICSRRLLGRLRETDIVARLGGDEFLVVLNNIVDEAQIGKVTNMLQQLLSQPYDIGLDQELFVGASIGVSIYPDHGTDVNQLLSNAEMAMYHAKSTGRNHSRFYSTDMTIASNDLLELSSQLRQALKKDCELELWYQPQMDARTQTLVGGEALIRWNHPQEGLIYPDRFLPVAEDAGLLTELDFWVLEKACSNLSSWQSLGYRPVVLAVNITQPTFTSGGLISRLGHLLRQYRIDPQWLELEITEGALLKPTPAVMDTIAGIKALGISLAVDDFGTGYSSLAYLHRYRVDKLKIDRSFISSLEAEEEEGRIITRTIINLAEGLGLRVLAEGVETKGQLDFMLKNGCDIFQGYYFSKPLPQKEFSRLLK